MACIITMLEQGLYCNLLLLLKYFCQMRFVSPRCGVAKTTGMSFLLLLEEKKEILTKSFCRPVVHFYSRIIHAICLSPEIAVLDASHTLGIQVTYCGCFCLSQCWFSLV